MRYFIILITAWLFVACQPAPTEDEPAPDENLISVNNQQLKQLDIKLGGLSQKTVPTIIKATGLVDVPPTSVVSIHAPIAGMVRNHTLLPGKHVHKGELLCEIAHQDIILIQQEYLENNSKLVYLKTDAERQEQLVTEDAGSAKKRDLAVADWKSVNARQIGLEARLKLIGLSPKAILDGKITDHVRILSPINGFVRTVNATQGMYATPQDALFEIVDKTHLHLELKVYEQDAVAIAENQAVTFKVAANNQKVQKAHVFLTGKSFDPVQKTVNIHAHLDQESIQEDLLPGMFVEAEIQTSEKKVYVLPLSAIAAEGDINFIFTLKSKDKDHDEFERSVVKVLRRFGTEAEIETNPTLLKNNQIVLTDAFKLQAMLVLGGEEEE